MVRIDRATAVLENGEKVTMNGPFELLPGMSVEDYRCEIKRIMRCDRVLLTYTEYNNGTEN